MNKNEFFPIQEPIVVLVGPTAIGKTALSIQLAHEFGFEIISVDSMQVYRFMNIGTAKITPGEMENIPHHLIDVVNPDESFDAGSFEKMACTAIRDIHSRGRKVLLTGGTGLYLRALLDGLSKQIPHFPEIRKEINAQLQQDGPHVLHEQLASIDQSTAKRIHPNDTHRLVRGIEIFRGTGKPWSVHIAEHQTEKQARFQNILTIGLTCEREKLYRRINKRSALMMENGLQEEVKGLLEAGYGAELKAMQSIGYSHMLKHLAGEWGSRETLEKLTRDTRRYAKRQFTWFTKMNELTWEKPEHSIAIKKKISLFLGTEI